MAKLPSVVSSIPQDLKAFINQVREALDGRNGNRLVTVNDLVNSGVTVPGPGDLLLPPPGVVGAPITPTNVQASGAIQNIIVTWDDPLYNGHSHAEIWGSSTDNLGAAVQVGMAPGAIFVDSVGPSVNRYYWVRFVNVLGVKGAFNAVAGVLGQTGSDVAYLLETLTGQITESQLFNDLAARIDLIDGPASITGTIPNQLALIQGQIDAINAYPDYDNATTYATNDIVKYNSGLYKALSTTTGNLPTNTTYWLKIGDYSSLADIVAVHTADITTLNTGLSGEITARETLATQMRGSYGGTDLTSVTSGLIFSERTARADADEGLATSISTVAATAAGKNRIYRQPTAPSTPTLNDIWVDTKVSYNPDYFSEEYAAPRFKQFQWNGTEWLDITDTDITDNFAFITREQTARATADNALAEDILTVAARVDSNTAAISVETSARATADSALASQITTLEAVVGDNTAAIQTETTARTTADSVLASQITTLQATVGDNTAAIQTEATVRADETGSLFAKYTVKVDVNGYVSGFGLASTANNATPFSEFAIRADRFYVASPSGPGITPIIPFIVNTTPQVVNGVDVPVGIYMDAAFIKNGTITTAKIGNATIDDAKIVSLTAAKITAGEISVGNYIQSSGFISGSQGWRIHGNGVAEFAAASIRGLITAAQIDSRGLSIKDASGNIILAAGSPLSTGNISGLGTLATQSSVSTGQVTGLGTLATQNAVDWNYQLVNIPGFGNFAYLNTITAANISTYIASAAIGTAYISNAAITNALIANGAISNAKIGDAEITTAKIGNAQVDTLKIAGNAVTVPQVSSASGSQAITTVTFAETTNVLLWGVCSGVVLVSGGCTIRLFDNYVQVKETFSNSAGGVIPTITLPIIHYMTMTAGTHTIICNVSDVYGNPAPAVETTVVIMGAKR